MGKLLQNASDVFNREQSVITAKVGVRRVKVLGTGGQEQDLYARIEKTIQQRRKLDHHIVRSTRSALIERVSLDISPTQRKFLISKETGGVKTNLTYQEGISNILRDLAKRIAEVLKSEDRRMPIITSLKEQGCAMALDLPGVNETEEVPDKTGFLPNAGYRGRVNATFNIDTLNPDFLEALQTMVAEEIARVDLPE